MPEVVETFAVSASPQEGDLSRRCWQGGHPCLGSWLGKPSAKVAERQGPGARQGANLQIALIL